jgi:hypothetical protein
MRERAGGSHKLRGALYAWLLAAVKCEIVTYEKYADGPIIASWDYRELAI